MAAPRCWLRLVVAVCILASVCLGAGPARAGIADSPLPQFADGKPSVRLLSIPGVVKRNQLQTEFLCTSFESTPMNIGVEIFDKDGTLLNDVHGGNGALLGVNPGQTVTFG